MNVAASIILAVLSLTILVLSLKGILEMCALMGASFLKMFAADTKFSQRAEAIGYMMFAVAVIWLIAYIVRDNFHALAELAH